MIITRRYVPFWILVSKEEKVANIFKTMFKKSNLPAKSCKELWEYWLKENICLAKATLGTLIPDIEYLSKELNKLDQESGYNNGFEINDVNKVEIIFKEENSLTLKLANVTEIEQIIQIITIKKDLKTHKPIFTVDDNFYFGDY